MTLASREAETISSWQALPFFLLEQFLLDNHKNNKMPAIKRQSNANRPKRFSFGFIRLVRLLFIVRVGKQ
jgi:hypothetical protein